MQVEGRVRPGDGTVAPTLWAGTGELLQLGRRGAVSGQ